MKYKNWLNEWLEYYIKPTVKARTYHKYQQIVHDRLLPNLGEYELSELTTNVLQRFMVSLAKEKFSSNTINVFLAVLKSSLKRAVSLGILGKEYTSTIVRPKQRERKIECLSNEEQKRIEDYIFQKKKPKLFGILLCLYMGLRIGELLALEWTDIDFHKGIVSITKTCHDSWQNGHYIKVIEPPKTSCSQRTIPIPKQLISYLKALQKQNKTKYVIDAEVRSFQRSFTLLLKRLNIEHKGFHSLRHTFATRALECGMDVKTLSEILGHSDAGVTLKRYAHSLLEHKREMMNRVGKFLS